MRIKHAKTGFVIAAGASFLFSVYLWFTGSKDEGVFVGLWVLRVITIIDTPSITIIDVVCSTDGQGKYRCLFSCVPLSITSV
jgi:hypothetical protein